uniref:Transposase n=1 Tax=Candidatus Kentrum sp. DK TaxID=2126562 RepID=A0A450TKN3_9GAMM|nr:MAG: transposase [Candidatus Kentron sp. DK]
MKAILQSQEYLGKTILYMAMELSNAKWKLGFSNGSKERVVTVEAGSWLDLLKQVALAKEKLHLPEDCLMVSCYEAGRDGFWIHRMLEENGIDNLILDPSSIEVNRRKRRAKTDKVDVKALLRLLIRYSSGERKAVSVVNVPTLEEEDQMRLMRERARLLKEYGAHVNRIKSLLVAHGIRRGINPGLMEELPSMKDGLGKDLGDDLKAEIGRQYQRLQVAREQIKGLEKEQKRRMKEKDTKALEQIMTLMRLQGVGPQSSWMRVMEFFSWRGFKNRRELAACAGLTPTPYDSGASQREQGISKAGSRRVRSMMIELAWLWLRYQPDSQLSLWFHSRFGNGKRLRRIGIVALARKLLVALWRYLETGAIPEGAVLKAS